jgi:hypothetical protein
MNEALIKGQVTDRRRALAGQCPGLRERFAKYYEVVYLGRGRPFQATG